MKHIEDLTCCRALFAGWVFAYHLNLQAHYASLLGDGPFGLGGRMVENGSLGVDGFFILSGMILAHAHPALRPTLVESRQFWAKRLVRIYPVHAATLALLAMMIGAAALLGMAPRDPQRFGVGELLSHLALLQAWGASDRWAWNYPSWSISAEWAGYLMFPLLWASLRKRTAAALGVIVALMLLAVAGCRAHANAADLSLTFDGGVLRLLPEFIGGMCVVPLLPVLDRGIRGLRLAAGGGLIVAVGALLSDPLQPGAALTIAGLWCVLAGLLLAARQGRGRVLARMPGLVWLGEVSYSFYMSFALVETLQATLWRRIALDPAQRPALYVLTTTALTLALATLFWAGVEKPALRAYARITRRDTRQRGLRRVYG